MAFQVPLNETVATNAMAYLKMTVLQIVREPAMEVYLRDKSLCSLFP